MRFKIYLNLVLISLSFVETPPVFAQTKRVVTYIEDVQEERKSTRWTLTEWLRIKERMKLMDLWLAMFSSPQEKFAPELVLGYAKGVGEAKFRLAPLDGAAAQSSEGTLNSEDIRAQFWFTNLISGTTGLRTLDIDLGLEGGVRNRFMKSLDSISHPSGERWSSRTDKLQTAGVNLRLFGASSQDSMLAIKGGKFEKKNGYSELGETSGTYFGGEMSLYLLSFLGAEGQYLQYLDGKRKLGSQVNVMGFLEIYNIRVGYGQSRHEWEQTNADSRLKTEEFERYLTVRLYF